MKKTALVLGLALVSTLTVASEYSGHGLDSQNIFNNIYVFGSFGTTDFRGLNSGVLGTSQVDDSSSLAAIGLGLQFHDNFAVELSHANLGEYAYTRGLQHSRLEAKTTNLVLTGTYPIGNQWNVVGRLGIAATESSGLNGRDTNTTGTFGLGVNYEINNKWSLGLHWDRYQNFAGTDLKLDTFSTRIQYSF